MSHRRAGGPLGWCAVVLAAAVVATACGSGDSGEPVVPVAADAAPGVVAAAGEATTDGTVDEGPLTCNDLYIGAVTEWFVVDSLAGVVDITTDTAPEAPPSTYEFVSVTPPPEVVVSSTPGVPDDDLGDGVLLADRWLADWIREQSSADPAPGRRYLVPINTVPGLRRSLDTVFVLEPDGTIWVPMRGCGPDERRDLSRDLALWAEALGRPGPLDALGYYWSLPHWTSGPERVEPGTVLDEIMERLVPTPAATDAPGWSERDRWLRSWIDDDVPAERAARLVPVRFAVEIDDPGTAARVAGSPLGLCPVQASATAGHCVGLEALADAGLVVVDLVVDPAEAVEMWLLDSSVAVGHGTRPVASYSVDELDGAVVTVAVGVADVGSGAMDPATAATTLALSAADGGLPDDPAAAGIPLVGVTAP